MGFDQKLEEALKSDKLDVLMKRALASRKSNPSPAENYINFLAYGTPKILPQLSSDTGRLSLKRGRSSDGLEITLYHAKLKDFLESKASQ